MQTLDKDAAGTKKWESWARGTYEKAQKCARDSAPGRNKLYPLHVTITFAYASFVRGVLNDQVKSIQIVLTLVPELKKGETLPGVIGQEYYPQMARICDKLESWQAPLATPASAFKVSSSLHLASPKSLARSI